MSHRSYWAPARARIRRAAMILGLALGIVAAGVVPASASVGGPSAFYWHCDVTADQPVGAYSYLFAWMTVDCSTPAYVVVYATLERATFISRPVVVKAGIDSYSGSHLAYLVRVKCQRPPGQVDFSFGALYQLRVFVVMTAGGTSIVESGVSFTSFVACSN